MRSRVFLGGQAASMLGDGLAMLAIPLLVLRLTSSPAVAVLAALPGSVGYLAAGLPAGVLADRIDPWLILLSGDVLRILIFLALFGLTGSRTVSAWLVLALAFAAGAVTVFTDTALDIAVRDVFDGSRLVTANSWLASADQVGLIAGPGIAGLLAAAGLLHVSMLINALTFAVSLASLAAVRTAYRIRRRPDDRRHRRTRAGALRRELAEGFRYLAATRLLFILLLFLLMLNLCLGADKLIIFLARNGVHLPPGLTGLVVTAGGVGGLLGAVSAGPLCRRLGPLPVIAAGSAASGLALILIGAATSAPLLLAGNAWYTWAIVAVSVTMRAMRQAIVPREVLGRVTAAWRLGGQAVTFAGGVLAGAMAGLLGGDTRPVFAAAGLLTLVSVAVAWAAGLRREYRASPASPLGG